MARSGKRTTQPRPPKAAPSGPRTTEDLSDEDLQALAFKHHNNLNGAEGAVKAAQKRVKEIKALAKAEMGADAIEVLKDLTELETEDGEKKLTQAVKRILRSARWAGSTLGNAVQHVRWSRPHAGRRSRVRGRQARRHEG